MTSSRDIGTDRRGEVSAGAPSNSRADDAEGHASRGKGNTPADDAEGHAIKGRGITPANDPGE